MARPVLLLSPHPDDIAWSLGGTTARLRELDVPVHVLTVFTWTRYAPGCAVHGTDEAVRVREKEERAWAELTSAAVHRCGLGDASVRGFDDETELGATPEQTVMLEVMDQLRAALARVRPQLVMAPLAAGGHVDHEAVRLAATELCPADQLVCYEDLPYADSAQLRSAGIPVTVDVAAHQAQIEAGVRCFPSQQPELILPVIRRHGAGNERLWASTARAATSCRELLDMSVHGR